MRHRNQRPADEIEALRQIAARKVIDVRRQSTPRASDPYWTSPSGHNYARWADKGFSIAMHLLQDTELQAGETGPAYLRRVILLVRAQRDAYRADAEDEDGACSGALDAAMWAMNAALPEELPPEEGTTGLNPGSEWEVWYQDMFDRETPRSVDVSGQGLVEGLMELWARHLFSRVRPDGGEGFARFNLWSEGQSIQVEGPWEGAVRLREWIYGDKGTIREGYVKEARGRTLQEVAAAHTRLILAGGSGEQILEMAAASRSRRDFGRRLKTLAETLLEH